MKIGLFGGSFDCIHNGHLNLIGRSLHFLDHLVIAVGNNPSKTPFFSNREELIKDSLKSGLSLAPKQFTITSFNGLLVDFAKEIKANVLVRGVRNASDLEHEMTMAAVNKNLSSEIETILLPARPELSIISSSMIRELITFKGDISAYVQRSVVYTAKNLSKEPR